MSYRLGVDVGGTFTDVLLVHENNLTDLDAKYADVVGLESALEHL
jgi:N-methylhydantoinase A/oxoprolinase/acetone carboxylase beta subunit